MKVLRAIAAVLAGLVVGGAVNMAIVMGGAALVPPPPGVDPASAESIAASIERYEAKHFAVPLIAHAAGTLSGALLACLIALSHRALIAGVIGTAFLAGGIAASLMIPAPAWFVAADLILAYLPMAWLGMRLAGRWRGS